MSTGEVGKVGVAISSIEDMEILLKDLPLEKISTSMTINSTAGILLALHIAVAKRRGISADKLTGTIQNDLLKEYIARGTYIFPPRPSLRVITDIFDYCAKMFLTGIRFQSQVITFVKRARQRLKKSRSHWPTESLTWKPRLQKASTSILSLVACRSFLMCTITSSKRSC